MPFLTQFPMTPGINPQAQPRMAGLLPTKMPINPLSMALLNAGLGILANNRGNYGAAGPAIGAGLQQGMNTYVGLLGQQQEQERLAKEIEREDKKWSREDEKYRREAEIEKAKQDWLNAIEGKTEIDSPTLLKGAMLGVDSDVLKLLKPNPLENYANVQLGPDGRFYGINKTTLQQEQIGSGGTPIPEKTDYETVVVNTPQGPRRMTKKQAFDYTSGGGTGGTRKLTQNQIYGLLSGVGMAESSGQPDVYGPETRTGEKAAGIWQFMPGTGREYGLNVDLERGIDERLDPQKAAEAATRMMTDLNERWGGDIDKMIASWNAGPEGVARAIANAQMSGGDWRQYLPQETQEYLPKVRGYVQDYMQSAETQPDTGLPGVPETSGKQYRTMTAEELKASGLPEGTVAQVNDVTGDINVVSKPKSDTQDEFEKVLSREQAKENVKRLKEYNSAADAAEGLGNDLAQMRGFRAKVTYEGQPFADARTKLGQWGLGILPGVPDKDEAGAAQALRSKGTEIQLTFSEKTKGAISDREMATFIQAVPGMQMTDEGANRVLDGMEAGVKRVREKAKFFERWITTNKNLDGAQEAWDRYIEENPVFKTDENGQMTVNKENIGNWKRYVEGTDLEPANTPEIDTLLKKYGPVNG